MAHMKRSGAAAVCLIISLLGTTLLSTNALTVVEEYHDVPLVVQSNELHTLHTTKVDTERSDSKTEWEELGFRMKITHTDAPSSPFSKQQASRVELHSRLVERDLARVDAIGKHVRSRSRHRFSKAAGTQAGPSLKDPVKSGLNSGTGEYFVTLQVWLATTNLHKCRNCA